jgi:C4-dicarboxylate transporter DctM subunit
MNPLIIILLLILLLLSGLPVAFSLASLAVALLIVNGNPLTVVPHMMYSALDSFYLSALPLFILMALILNKGRVGEILFDGINGFVGHIPGGLAIATVICCAIFAAIAGTSTAVAVTIGIIAIPAMRQHGYKKSFATGLMAAGGTLGQLIPPSVPMILFAAVTEESIGSLFVAGIIPGIVLAACFILYIFIVADRGLSSSVKKTSWHDRWKKSKKALYVALLVPIVMGGIYTGIFTPSEAAAVGVVYSFILCLFIYKTLSIRDVPPVLTEAVYTSTMLLLIVSAATLFGNAITMLQIPQGLVDFVVSQDLSKWTFLIFLNLLYLLLGCFLEAAAMILITVPIFLPILKELNIDLIWFAVILVMNIEIAMVTPPVGLNLFVLKGIVPDATMDEIFVGSMPFLFLIVFVLILVMVFPSLATVLLQYMG